MFFNLISPRKKHQQLSFNHSARQLILIRFKHSHRDCSCCRDKWKNLFAQNIVMGHEDISIIIVFYFAYWNAKNNNNDLFPIFPYVNNYDYNAIERYEILPSFPF